MELPTVAAVRRIFPQASADDAVVQDFIDEAALVASRCAGLVAAAAANQSSAVKWIAAHLMAVGSSNGGVSSESIGKASKSYAMGPMGDNLKSTVYGQRALLLDPSGCLARLGFPKPIFVAG